MTPVSSHSVGQAGEAGAARILEAEGFSILSKNYRAGPGELDLVAVRGDLVLFVEVKSWSVYTSSELERSIGPAKRRRIIETSKIFLSEHRQYSEASIRYDVFLMRGELLEERYEAAFTG